MHCFRLQPTLYPTSVILVDDNSGYHNMLRRVLPASCLGIFYSSPRAAIDHLFDRGRSFSHGEIDAHASLEQLEDPDTFYDRLTTLGHDIATVGTRFEEISAVVVDYNMPEINGIEFLAAIKTLECTKILLTGVADEALAVEAFNAGIVDYYLKKSDDDFVRKFTRALSRAQRRHCAARGLVGLNGIGRVYCDERVCAAIDHVVEKNHIAEYYWRAEQNALLMFNYAGEPSVFVAWSDEEWSFQCDVARDEHAPEGLQNAMRTREVMPVFWPARAFSATSGQFLPVRPEAVDQWPGTHYGWSALGPDHVGTTLAPFAGFLASKRASRS